MVSFYIIDLKPYTDITFKAKHHTPSPKPVYLYGHLQKDIAEEELPWHEGITSMFFYRDHLHKSVLQAHT